MAIGDRIRARRERKKSEKQLMQTQESILDEGSHKDQIDAQQEAKTSYGLGGKGHDNGETLTYPQELFSASQPHAVHFYINARQTSVAATDAVTAANTDEAMRQRLIEANQDYNEEYTKENRAKAEEYETVATGAGALAASIGTMAGISSGHILKDGATKLGKVLTTAAGGIVGAFLGNAMGRMNQTSTIRLLKTIQLYVPQSIVSAYAANWDETNLGVAGLLGSGRMDFKDLAEAPEFIGRGLISAAANLPKAIGADADFGAAIEATSKKVSNPYKEQLFKSMGFRRFSFNYTFVPRNPNEADMVMEIVDTFKYHMHPEASEGDLFLVYPAEFSIQFEYLDKNGNVDLNPHLPKISSCALTGCKVTYGPDGAFNTFKNSGGMPTEINMELAFTELETLTAVRIAQGF